MATIEFFYDLSSPWTRLAFRNIQPIAREAGAELRWRPFLVGGVFNAANPGLYANRAAAESAKSRHTAKVLADWARHAGVAMNFPSPHHPLKSVIAMRACCALENDQAALARFSEAAFEAYFNAQRNLDDPAVLAQVATEAGFDGEALVRQAGEDAIKQRLRANTDEAVQRGAYGSPTIFLDGDDMYFGNDQLPLVRQALGLE